MSTALHSSTAYANTLAPANLEALPHGILARLTLANESGILGNRWVRSMDKESAIYDLPAQVAKSVLGINLDNNIKIRTHFTEDTLRGIITAKERNFDITENNKQQFIEVLKSAEIVQKACQNSDDALKKIRESGNHTPPAENIIDIAHKNLWDANENYLALQHKHGIFPSHCIVWLSDPNKGSTST